MELTKEYLDQKLDKQFDQFKEYFDTSLDKKLDEKLDEKLDQKLANFATKDDLKAQSKELKDYIHQAFEAQQVYIDVRFQELFKKMMITERLNQHEYWIDKIAGKVGVKLGEVS